jgi:glutathione peroxidase-family protein
MGHMLDLIRKGDYVDNPYKSFYEIRARNLNLDYTYMNSYLSNVLLVVNVSPYDKDFQREIEELNEIKDKFKKEQFNILAFPSSQLDKLAVSDKEMKEKLEENNIARYSNINFFNRVRLI